MFFKNYLQTGVQYAQDEWRQSGEAVRFYNWFVEDSFWFRKFIQARKIPCDRKKDLAFFSVFGEKFPIRMVRSHGKVFFTGENLHRHEFGFSYRAYSDHLESRRFDLSLGFDYLEAESYLRFPLWILRLSKKRKK